MEFRSHQLDTPFNGTAASENKIHDDTVARRFGFRGALVPGVEVFAYMAHVPVAHFGRAWLEQGEAECREATSEILELSAPDFASLIRATN